MRKAKAYLMTIVIFLVMTIQLWAQEDTAWVRRYDGGDDRALALSVDSASNVYVIGHSDPDFNSSNGRDFVVLKYNSQGSLLWERRYDGGLGIINAHEPTLAIDHGGNAYVTGSGRRVGPGDYEYVTLKYSPDGALLWERRYDGPGYNDDLATAIAVDPLGNVIVTGASRGAGGDNDCATIKYNPDGDTVWVRRYHNSYESATALAVDQDGNILVTGGSSDGVITLKYGDEGTLLWVRYYSGPVHDDYATAIALDATGNICVSGPGRSGGADSEDFLTIKYAPDGTAMWVRRYGCPSNCEDIPHALGIDADGNVFVAGASPASGISYDGVTLKYGADGTPIWERHYNGIGSNRPDYASALQIDAFGNVYVGGSSDRSSSSVSNFDFFVQKYDTDGNQAVGGCIRRA